MSIQVKKIAPTLAVLAVLGYCCWPDSVGVDAKAKTKDKKREISQVLLAPKAAPSPTRDPFEESANAVKVPKESAKKAIPIAPVVPAESQSEQITGIALKATFMSGERRLALINDKFYAEGDTVCSATLKTSVVLAAICPDVVVLEHQGQHVELTFLNEDRKGPTSTKGERKIAKVNVASR